MRSQHKRRVSSYRWRPRLESLEGRLAPGTCFRASGMAALHTPHGVEESIQHSFVSSWFLQMEREKKMRGETCYSETNSNARHAVTENTRIGPIACSSSSRLEVAARERFLESPIQLSLEDPHFCDSMWGPELDRAVPIKGALASADSRTPATDVFLGDAKILGAPSTRTGMVRQFDSGIALSRPQYVAASQLLSSSVKVAPERKSARAQQGMAGESPLQLEPNLGQQPAEVKFLARAPGYTLFLTAAEAVMVITEYESVPEPTSNDLLQNTMVGRETPPRIRDQSVIRMRWDDANGTPTIRGENRLPGISNYFIGNDPSNWVTEVPHFGQVVYEDVYPGIDLTFYDSGQRQMEYDWIVAPGADPADIRMVIEGAETLDVDADGNLVMRRGRHDGNSGRLP